MRSCSDGRGSSPGHDGTGPGGPQHTSVGPVVTRGQGFAFEAEYALGYGSALVAALAWSTYSVLSRRYASVPSEAITGFCLATAVLAAACHLLLERTVKTVLHELGHTCGLVHCADPTCAMALATGVSQLDAKEPRYCQSCRVRMESHPCNTTGKY